jgi:hypothetical protein
MFLSAAVLVKSSVAPTVVQIKIERFEIKTRFDLYNRESR